MADESRLNDSAYSYAVATLPATGLAWWRRRLVLAAAATGLLILFCLYLVWRHDVIVVAFDGEPLPVHQLGGTVQSALGAADVQLLPTDRVVPALGTPLHDGLRIRVVHTFPLTLTDGGKAVQVRSAGESVGALLELLGVTLGPLDEVHPALDHVLQPGDAVQIVRVKRETVTMNASVPYPVKRWADPTLAQGITKVQQAGVPGEALQTFRVTYRDGVESQRELLAAKVTQAPTAEILSVGTSPVVHTLHVGGATYRYSRSLKVLATAYYPGPLSTGDSADGYTSTGLVAKRGIIAVDPKVIPLGTKVYVPGYGVAVAGDVGGAIKGNHIDLLYDTYDEAINYGRKILTVYILVGNET